MSYIYYQTAAVTLLLILVIGYFIFDYYSYKKTLYKIPLRIHVNGTRGKSSVTRLIAGGLRAYGFTVCAKTTGSAAKFIRPSGEEHTLKRYAPPNIKEITDFVRHAANKYQANAIVVECMAVTPEYQQVLEDKFLQAQILALTNIRQDHEDIMGEGLESVARALAKSLPKNGNLFTGADSGKLLEQLQLLPTDTVISDSIEVSEQELADFPYEVIKENVQLALAVCLHVGVPRQIALLGMIDSAPDIGNLNISHWQHSGGSLRLVNALAANDPDSTIMLWHKYIAPHEDVAMLIHCRADRKERTRQLLAAFIPLHRGIFLLSGDSDFAYHTMLRLGIDKSRILALPNISQKAILALDIVQNQDITVIFAAGNLKGCTIFEREVG